MPYKILLIDDDPLVRQSVRLLLQKQGYLVCVVTSVAEAIIAIDIDDYDLILSDIRMPDVDGVTGAETITNIIKKRWAREIPIVFITGYSGVGKELSAQNIGETISKPFDVNQLLVTIRDYL